MNNVFDTQAACMDARAIREQAAAYLDLGWQLVPLILGTKRPQRPNWNQRDQCIASQADLDRIADGQRHGLGLAHAYSGTAALDVDDLAGARAALLEHGIDLDALDAAPDAVRIDSGRLNRLKLLYRLPEGQAPLPSRKITAAGQTLYELRCATKEGDTVQDVLPPSVHPETSQPYRWAGPGDWRQLPILPDALLAHWLTSSATASVAPPTAAPAQSEAPADIVARRQACLDEMLRVLKPDLPYADWLEVGMALHTLGSEYFTVWDTWSARGKKYRADEMFGKWCSFATVERLGIATLVHRVRHATPRRPMRGRSISCSIGPIAQRIRRPMRASSIRSSPPPRPWRASRRRRPRRHG